MEGVPEDQVPQLLAGLGPYVAGLQRQRDDARCAWRRALHLVAFRACALPGPFITCIHTLPASQAGS